MQSVKWIVTKETVYRKRSIICNSVFNLWDSSDWILFSTWTGTDFYRNDSIICTELRCTETELPRQSAQVVTEKLNVIQYQYWQESPLSLTILCDVFTNVLQFESVNWNAYVSATLHWELPIKLVKGRIVVAALVLYWFVPSFKFVTSTEHQPRPHQHCLLHR